MLASERKLRISFSLSPELRRALDEYAESFKVSQSAFAEDALWIYLNSLDKHMKPESSVAPNQFQNEEALVA
jgi:predicted transcriptional regulator